jgi:hypothetical protein
MMTKTATDRCARCWSPIEKAQGLIVQGERNYHGKCAPQRPRGRLAQFIEHLWHRRRL